MKKVTSFLVMVLVATTLTSVSITSYNNKEKYKVPKIEKSDFVVPNDLTNVENETSNIVFASYSYDLLETVKYGNDVLESNVTAVLKCNVAFENSIHPVDPFIDPGSTVNVINYTSDYILRVSDIPEKHILPVNLGRDIGFKEFTLANYRSGKSDAKRDIFSFCPCSIGEC